jgi:probable rRNA maturation factor
MLRDQTHRIFSSSITEFKGTVKDTQHKFEVNKALIGSQVAQIQEILGVSEFAVDVWFCSENKIRELNGEWRGKKKSTDVLSFPSCDFLSPGVFDESDPALQFEKHLGDIVISPAYVQRQLQRDKLDFENGNLCLSDEKGVSRALATTFKLEERYRLLLVHSVIHLLGYDHETDEDWTEMARKEEEVMTRLSL